MLYYEELVVNVILNTQEAELTILLWLYLFDIVVLEILPTNPQRFQM